MLAKLIAALQKTSLDMTAQEIADMLWLAPYLKTTKKETDTLTADTPSQSRDETITSGFEQSDEPAELSTSSLLNADASVNVHPTTHQSNTQSDTKGFPFRSPAASALPNTLLLARALRPLMHRLPSKTQFVLNQQATVQRIAETDQRIWAPVLDPLPIRRFDIELVVDVGASMLLWQQVVTEWRTLLEHHGAFRNVRAWRITTDDHEHVQLYAGMTRGQDHPHDPKELIDPSGRRLILVITDCVSPAWHSGKVQSLLDVWGHQNLVSLIQVFPRRLWQQTSLANGDLIQIDALLQHISNSQLKTHVPVQWFTEDLPVEERLAYPVVTLEYRSLHNWVRMITRTERTWIPGILFSNDEIDGIDEYEAALQHPPLSPARRVQLFHASASPTARKLIELLAAAPIPINLQIIQLIRHTMVPEASQIHIAEVMLSGLLEEIYRDPTTNDFNNIEYDFVAGVRDELLNAVAIPSAHQVLREISSFVEHYQGKARDFLALITMPDRMDKGIFITHESRPFAKIASTVLSRYGGNFATTAKKLEQQIQQLDSIEVKETSDSKKMLSEPPQTYTPSTTESPNVSNTDCLSTTWCDLDWMNWMPFDSPAIKTLPSTAGVYRVRAIGRPEIFYIGYTNRGLRERINDLIRNVRNPTQMPFTDPHVAAPALWAWKEATGIDFECSAAPLELSKRELETLVCYLLWQYRLERGTSTLCNYGRFHPQYTKSGNRSTGRRGQRLPEGEVNNASGPSFPPLPLVDLPHETTWMGLNWSALFPITSSNRQNIPSSPGVYKVLDADTTQLLFVGHSKNLRTIFQARTNWGCQQPVFSCVTLPENTPSYQLAEVETDLIGGYYERTKMAPKLQFGDAQEKMDVSVENSNIEGAITVIEALHVQQTEETKDEFEPIHNPYTYSGGYPVLDPKMLYGRDGIITRIARNISENSQQRRSFVIFGQKRSGKSSILYHLKEKLLKESDLLILSLSLGSITTEDFSFSLYFFWQILNNFKLAIEEEINRKKRVPLKLPFLRDTDFFNHPTPLSHLRDIFRLFYQFTEEKSTWHNVRVVILIDEFQYIYDQIVQAKLSPDFMKNWKALSQENIFSTVLVGQDVMTKFIQLFPNEFGLTQFERVRDLEREDAIKLIDEPIRIGGKNGKSRYRGKTIEHILYLSAGNPFYIQMICNRLVEHMNRVRANFIIEADIDKVKSEMLEGANSLEIDKFDNLTSSGDNSPDAIAQDDALKVLRAIALNSKTKPCNRNSIICETQTPIDTILDDLVTREVINRGSGNNYTIRVGLFKEWLIAHSY